MQTLKGECGDVVTKLEVLASRAVGLHKVRDVCEVLDAGEVLDEGVANKDSEEMTYYVQGLVCLRAVGDMYGTAGRTCNV